MKVLYTRVSTNNQSIDRQLENEKNYDLIIRDMGISGSVPFWERPKAGKIKKLLKNDEITELHTHSIDRLGRNLRDILNTIEYFHNHQVPITIISQGLTTYDRSRREMNPTTKLILQIMGSVAEMERSLTIDRIRHSLSVKKMNGQLLGRKKGSTERPEAFLKKEKSVRISKYLSKGYSIREIASIVGCGTQLVQKVSKMSKSY